MSPHSSTTNPSLRRAWQVLLALYTLGATSEWYVQRFECSGVTSTYQVLRQVFACEPQPSADFWGLYAVFGVATLLLLEVAGRPRSLLHKKVPDHG